MITTTATFATEAEARQHGQAFKDAWGWGYDGSFRVWCDPAGMWVCSMTRARSCD